MTTDLIMDALQVSAEVATFSELFVTNIADERSNRCVFLEMVTQIAALAENRITVSKFALKVKLGSFCFSVLHLDGLMPLDWNSFKLFLGCLSV